MSAEPAPPRLVLVDTESGHAEPYEGDGTEVLALREEKRDLEQKLYEAEKDLRAKRSKITELQNLKAVERLKADARPLIEEVFGYWQRVTGHERCTLTGDRFDTAWELVKASGVDIQDEAKARALVRRMKLAVDGCHFDPFTTRRKNGTTKVHDDFCLIFRSTDKMEEYCRKSPAAAEAMRRRQARQRAAARDARLRLPDPRSLGGSWALEAKMRSVMNGTGPHMHAR